jgi:hypothetical protein
MLTGKRPKSDIRIYYYFFLEIVIPALVVTIGNEKQAKKKKILSFLKYRKHRLSGISSWTHSARIDH